MSSMLQCVTQITRTGIDSTVRTLFDFLCKYLIFFLFLQNMRFLIQSPYLSCTFNVHEQLRAVVNKTIASTSLGIWAGLSLTHVGDPAQVQHNQSKLSNIFSYYFLIIKKNLK